MSDDFKITKEDYNHIWWLASGKNQGETYYCSKCGLQLYPLPLNKFNVKTGVRLVHYVCPSKNCVHDGWIHNYVKRSLKDRFKKEFFNNLVCAKCGDMGNDHDGWD